MMFNKSQDRLNVSEQRRQKLNERILNLEKDHEDLQVKLRVANDDSARYKQMVMDQESKLKVMAEEVEEAKTSSQELWNLKRQADE